MLCYLFATCSVCTERAYKQAKTVLRKELGLDPNDKSINFHHIIERQDKKDHLIPDDFPINNRSNLVPLPIDTHDTLHYIDQHYFHNDISTRVYLANMAYNSELDLVPDRIFCVMPCVRK